MPALLYAIPLGAALWLHRVAPLWMPDGSGRTTFGVLLAVVGAALCASGIVSFASSDTTIIPHRAVSTIVTRGPYRFSRNPMYAGLALAYAGVSVLARSWWPLLALPSILVAMRRLAIDPEEEYLRAKFGSAYEAYCRRVRRWL